MSAHFDFIIVGSGFGGSVSALRLSEKGYSVCVLEKGRRFNPGDFPKTNWDLRRWMWMPSAGLRGIFQMSFLKHVTVLHGVGVGGGSLVYANTLPTPKLGFFQAKSWSHLADWRKELMPHYATAKRMLGATEVPFETVGDRVLKEVAKETGREEHFHRAEVGVYFGQAGKKAADPYFDGEGPERVGCTQCGACMTGCNVGAKNTLDRNYLYLAEKLGCVIEAETEVQRVVPLSSTHEGKNGGYRVETKDSFGSSTSALTADNVVFSGGVMGTVPLLLAMKEDALPKLSPVLGQMVRTNSEALFAVVAPDTEEDFTRGVAITSILHTDEHSHVEPVRYGRGSGFFRTMLLPHGPGSNLLSRGARAAKRFSEEPARWARALTVRDISKHSLVLLYMQTLDGTLRLRLGRSARTAFRRSLVTEVDDPKVAPQAFIPEATDIAERFAKKVRGVVSGLFTETLLGVPSTAHILGGCTMGESAASGVIDSEHRVFGYEGLYVIDGSAMSANPGVNPSLTITAMAERAMSKIRPKNEAKKAV